MSNLQGDVEVHHGPNKLSHFRMVLDQSRLTPEIEEWQYDGSGTEQDPFIVEWLEHDPGNPLRWRKPKKWAVALTMAFATLAVSFCSSAFSGGMRDQIIEFHASQEVVTLGLSLYVLGFALGPLIWAPLSELYGRQIVFVASFGLFAVFNAAGVGAKNIQTVIVLRLLAGSFGSSPLTNAGGVIADLFSAKERGRAMSVFSIAPFMGPVLGPIGGSFLGEARGWKWIQALMAMVAGFVWIIGSCTAPETYPPVLLRRRAEALAKKTGRVYISRGDIDQGKVTFVEVFKTSLARPWVLLFKEPIVLMLSVYMAIIYGTLYMLFGAYPIVYQKGRGWSSGISSLAFVGVAVGMLLSLLYTITVEDKKYQEAVKRAGGFAAPEDRLLGGILGGIVLPVGLFWFAWTNGPSIHWLVSVAAAVPFGFGMVLVFLSVTNYLIDSYTIFAASVLAANSVLRSTFGAAFPLFTTQMYSGLGIHWASTIPAFLALVCMPLPFLFYKYGASIRRHCKYAAEADEFMKKLRGQVPRVPQTSNDSSSEDVEKVVLAQEREEEAEQAAFDYSYKKHQEPVFETIKGQSQGPGAEYEQDPYTIDRVNTRESFKAPEPRSRASSKGQDRIFKKIRSRGG